MKEYVVWAILATLFYLMISQQVFADDVGYARCEMEIKLELVAIPRDQILVYNSSVQAVHRNRIEVSTAEQRTCYLIARHIDQLVLKIEPEDVVKTRNDQ